MIVQGLGSLPFTWETEPWPDPALAVVGICVEGDSRSKISLSPPPPLSQPNKKKINKSHILSVLNFVYYRNVTLQLYLERCIYNCRWRRDDRRLEE